MNDENFRSVGEILQDVLAGLACMSHTDGNVVDFQKWKLAHARDSRNCIARESQAPALSEWILDAEVHAAPRGEICLFHQKRIRSSSANGIDLMFRAAE